MRADSESYVNGLRKLGVSIGTETSFIDPRTTNVDITRPWMVRIGSGCTITPGVTIMSHDYTLPVVQRVYGEVIASRMGAVTIGDNVYIGMHTTIVAGTTIGSNVIIGANSLVCKDIPDNCVAAGNPARVISTLDAYYQKRKAAYLQEAKEMVRAYIDTYRKDPPKELLYEHFWLFANREEECIPPYKAMIKTDTAYCHYLDHEKPFASYEAFLEYCRT